MKMEELKELKLQELKDKLEDTRSELGKLRLDHAISPLENPMLMREKKKDIARMLTELNTREEESTTTEEA